MTDEFFGTDHDIVASFKLKKPVSLLEDNILQLEEDIFNEIDYPTIKVLALSFISLLHASYFGIFI